ncbi:hypothetical protein ACP275_04G032000 [Erythranthe tilingii]
MANSIFWVLCFITYTVLLLSAQIWTVDAKDCMEGLTSVDVQCNRSEASQNCWDACRKRHGSKATAFCRASGPGFPGEICFCSYPC